MDERHEVGEEDRWLEGESIVALVGRHGRPSALPDSFRAVAGPCLLTATRFDGSPDGPFLELAVAEPARLGARLGWCRTSVVVDHPDVERTTRARWDSMAQPGSLVWRADGDRRWLRWCEAGVEVSGRVGRGALPWVLPQRVLRRQAGEAFVVPARLRGLLHACAVHVVVEDPGIEHRSAAAWRMVSLEGRHLGAVVTGLRTRVRPARAAAPASVPRATLTAPRPEAVLRDGPAVLRDGREVGADLG